MTNRTTEEIARGLTELAERCEKAMGPDRELDVLVFQAVGAPVPFQFANRIVALAFDEAEQCYFAPIGDMRIRYEPPAYTASLDAAMTLVPERWRVSKLDEDWRSKRWVAQLSRRVSPSLLKAFDEGRTIGWDTADTAPDAATPALALTAAALRALAVRSHLESHKP